MKISSTDLTTFAPFGNGYYGYQKKNGNPFKDAPPMEGCAGTIFFENDILKDEFDSFLRIMKMYTVSKDFIAISGESKKPAKDGYISQIRIISRFGLRYLFDEITEADYEKFTNMEVSIPEVLWTFIENEKKRWGTSFAVNKGLGGMFGGDGDCEREELSFGFTVENSYYGIYRIWSRAWLVTK